MAVHLVFFAARYFIFVFIPILYSKIFSDFNQIDPPYFTRHRHYQPSPKYLLPPPCPRLRRLRFLRLLLLLRRLSPHFITLDYYCAFYHHLHPSLFRLDDCLSHRRHPSCQC